MKARLNPLRSSAWSGLGYHFSAGSSWDEVCKRFLELGCKGAVQGEQGSGKTTFLQEFEHRLNTLGLQAVRVSAKDFPISSWFRFRRLVQQQAQARTVLLLDDADVLPLPHRLILRCWLRRLPGLALAVHGHSFLPAFHHCRTSPALLGELLTEIAPAQVSSCKSAELFLKHRGNVREVFRELYQLAAEDRLEQ